MDYQTFQVDQYHQDIPRHLAISQEGAIHSIFNNGFNIRMGTRLLFIGTIKNGKLPFGMHMEADQIKPLVTSVSQNAEVVWEAQEGTLTIEENHIKILVKGDGAFMNTIEKMSSHPRSIHQHLETFLQIVVGYGEPTGLDVDIEQFMLDYVENKTDVSDVAAQLYKLKNAAFSENVTDIEQVLRYFLGRGKGLTPSGDDHLVGLLALHTQTAALSPVFVNTLKTIIFNETITTDVGTQYLQSALEERFSSAVVDVMNDMAQNRPEQLQQDLGNLLPMGHSSGVDTAFGILLGMVELRRQHTWDKKSY